MNNITINYKKRTIEIGKNFEKQAQKFRSEAYNELAEARREFPEFKVVIKSTSGTKTLKGMDYKFMKEYIANHEDAEKNLVAFEKLHEAGLAYGEILQWFVSRYPVFENCKTRADWVLAA